MKNRNKSSCAVRRLAFGMFALLLSIGFLGDQVRAHSRLESTSPADRAVVAAPAIITLTFNEEVSSARIVLRNQAKSVINTKLVRTGNGEVVAVKPLKPLSKGLYKVSWRVRSSDGHYLTGNFSFTVV